MHHPALRVVYGALIALCLWTLSATARAETRVVVRNFSGPSGAAARKAVVRVIGQKSGFRVLSNDDVEGAARRRSVRPDGPIGRKEVGRDLEVAAWVEGSVKKRAGKLELTVVVRSAQDNDEVASFSAKRKKGKQLDKAVHSGLWRALGPALESARAPEPEYQAPPEGTDAPVEAEPLMPVAESDNAEEPPMFVAEEQRIDGDEEPSDPPARTALEAAVTMNSLSRTLRFNDAFTQGIANYRLGAAPMADVAARIYPAAFFRDDWATYIGLDLHAQLAFALKSEGIDQTEYNTHYDGYGAGLVGRYPLGQHEVNALVGYNAQRFRVDNAGDSPAPVPNVNYRSVRFGLGGKVAVMQRLKLGAEAAWQLIQGSGELAAKAWFPRAEGSGLEGMLYADVSIIGALQARARVSYQRTYFDFNSKVGDNRVAGGATDDYFSGGLGLAYAY